MCVQSANTYMAGAGPQKMRHPQQMEQNTGPAVAAAGVAAAAVAGAVVLVVAPAVFLPGCSIASSTRPKRQHWGRPRAYLQTDASSNEDRQISYVKINNIGTRKSR